jgi:NAD(P)-dependent dehydrogenase (short-subunit alcohol dehydrogenase family)
MSEQITEVTTATGRPEREFLGRHAVATGGTRGIGAAAAASLSGFGASVVISARTPAEVPAYGVELVVADAVTIAGAERRASEAELVLGEVDILVNSAGGAKSALIRKEV